MEKFEDFVEKKKELMRYNEMSDQEKESFDNEMTAIYERELINNKYHDSKGEGDSIDEDNLKIDHSL